MNVTDLVKRTLRKLHYPRFTYLSTEEILDVIREESILTFSEWYPYKAVWKIDPTEDAVDPIAFPGLFKVIPDDCAINAIRDIGFIYTGVDLSFGGYARGITRSAYGSIQSLMYSQLGANIASMNQNIQTTAEFKPPNLIQIWPKSTIRPGMKTTVAVELILNHREDFTTIPAAYERMFKELCEYDCKIRVLDKYPDLADDGVIGGQPIKTMIADFKEAESKRDELLRTFQENYLYNPDRCDMFYIL